MDNIRHGVLCDDSIAYLNNHNAVETVKCKRPVTAIGGAWYEANVHGFTHFWVMPGSIFDQRGYTALNHSEDFVVHQPFGTHDHKNRPQYPTAARVRMSNRTGNEVLVVYPCASRFRWEVRSPEDILYAVCALENNLQVVPEWSPMYMGRMLLKSFYKGVREDWLRKPMIDMRNLPFDRASKDVSYKRKLELWMDGLYAHWYDKNSHYLGAAQGLTVGCGDPIHVTHEPFDWKLQGIYKVKIHSTTWPDYLPPIIDTEWVNRDVLKFAIESGYDVEITEAYQFEESHTLFSKWAKRLWDARCALKPNTSSAQWQVNAYETIKEIAVVGGGRFNSKGDWNEAMYRPNWWRDLVSKARVNTLYHVRRFNDQGEILLSVHTDELCYLTSYGDIREAVPGILDREGGLGGFKPTYSLQLTEEIIRQSWVSREPSRYLKSLATKYAEVQHA